MNIKNILKKHIKSFVLTYIRISNRILIKISPVLYIKIKYKKIFKTKINLTTPTTFSEKIQWLKLYNHDPHIVTCADKYKVRDVVKKIVGDTYLIKMPYVWDTYKDIDFSALPDSFVLKPNNSSGSVILCTDKKTLDIDKTIKTLKKWQKQNISVYTGEWVYNEIPFKIVCEEYLDDDIVDYKFYFANGEFICTQVISGRNSGKKVFLYYDEDWNKLNINRYKISSGSAEIPRPDKYSEMLDVAKKLAQGFVFVRVDLYHVNEKIYFGELSFYPNNGFVRYETKEMDDFFSSKLTLPNNLYNENKENDEI